MSFPALPLPADLQLLLLVVAVFGLTVGLTLAMTVPAPTPTARLAAYSLRRGSPGAAAESMGMRDRLLSPVGRRLIGLAASTAPHRVREATASQLVMAGSSVSPTTFLAIRAVVLFGLPLLVLTQLLPNGLAEPMDWGILGLSAFWGRRVPGIWLKRRIRARQRAIDRRLPYAVDLMVACLEGGLSLDAALAKVAEQSEGPLSVEIRKTLQELALGRPAGEAMRALGERTGAPELKLLTGNMAQAERMGISLTETLRVMARESRVRRRQQAEEIARKAPIKMIPVLIFFVLPALGMVIMAPAAIILLRVFSETTP